MVEEGRVGAVALGGRVSCSRASTGSGDDDEGRPIGGARKRKMLSSNNW